MPICLNWQCWINITATVPYSLAILNSTSATAITESTTTTTNLTEQLSASNTVQDLQDQIFRLKLGLGIGLGVPLVLTSAATIGLIILHTSRYKNIF
jgi:hypothetical protein